ncbi:hypothetical protein CTI12_AA267800 [Artemisia annua]|uniref:Gag-Pol polyprotein n=1 Tax=Artemisia annua TaxID=35608 RepID=A0A2U1NGZ6_ARTAN|nr:hypothetical protein CTI12_AA267800 [Artemisia annua]
MHWLLGVMLDLLCCIRKTMFNGIQGPYVFKEIDHPNNPGKTRLQEEEDLSEAELTQYGADIRAKNMILFGLSNEIYNAIDSNLIAHDFWKDVERLMQRADVGTQTQQTLALWNYQSFKQLPDEILEDSSIRFNKLINEMDHHYLKRSNIEHNTMFLTNLQPKWRRFTIAISQNQDLTKNDINYLFDLLKHSQVEVNDIKEEMKKKETPIQQPIHDPLALVSLHQPKLTHNSLTDNTNNNIQ